MKKALIYVVAIMLMAFAVGCENSVYDPNTETTYHEGSPNLVKDLALSLVRLPIGNPDDVHYKFSLENLSRPEVVEGDFIVEAFCNNTSSG